jgi:uncharacterized membrane protein (UPF0127 family)
MKKLSYLLVLLALVSFRLAHAQAMPVLQLNAGMHLIKAEVAANFADRGRGLMYRERMASNEGMVFLFEERATHCMWMKNTLLPLSVAFLGEDGTILNIEDMKPQTEQSHCAAKPARFALEMNQGWFKQRGIKAGMKISGLEPLMNK